MATVEKRGKLSETQIKEEGGSGKDDFSEIESALVKQGMPSGPVGVAPCSLSHRLVQFPDYFCLHTKTQHLLMAADGPLSLPVRHCIAIMGSAIHSSQHLMGHQEHLLSTTGGEAWLSGAEKFPDKLQALAQVNIILAKRPWMLNKHHIASLAKEGWSITQIVHAIVILSHFHATSGTIHASGIELQTHTGPITGSVTKVKSPRSNRHNPPESNRSNRHNPPESSRSSRHNPGDPTRSRRPTRLSRSLAGNSSSPSCRNSRNLNLNCGDNLDLNFSKESLSSSVDILESSQLDNINQRQEQGDSKPSVRPVTAWLSSHETLWEEARMKQEDGVTTQSTQETIIQHNLDQSWDDFGFSVLCYYYENAAFLLDSKFNCLNNLEIISNKQNKQQQLKNKEAGSPDIYEYKEAVWNYIQSIYGIMHDDYDYNIINKIIEAPQKTLIKIAATCPEKFTKGIKVEIKHLMLTCVIIQEARMQAELLYALKAVIQFMNANQQG